MAGNPYGYSNPFPGTTTNTPVTAGPSASTTTTSTATAEPVIAEKIRRHPHYYLNGGDVHFLVENYLFRVHRYFFERESHYFRERLSLPANPGQQAKGSADNNPFPLDDVQAIDFSRFLWVFYNPKYSIYNAGIDDWSAILKLAFEWKFTEVKALALRELERFQIDPVQKIDLYQRYEVDRKLLIPSFALLTFRPEPLNLQEGRRLGLETALLLAEAREYARGKRTTSGGHTPISATVDQQQMEGVIATVFNIDTTVAPPPAEENDNIFGIAPVPPRVNTNVSAQTAQSRTASPPPATSLPGPIFKALSTQGTVVLTPAPSSTVSPTKEGTKQSDEPAAPAPPAKSGNPSSGQAVTSPPPPSSVNQPLIPDSSSQETQARTQQRSNLPPLQIPNLSQTSKPKEVTVQAVAPHPPAPDKKTTAGAGAGVAQAGLRGTALDGIPTTTTTTTPVVDTPQNTSEAAAPGKGGKVKKKKKRPTQNNASVDSASVDANETKDDEEPTENTEVKGEEEIEKTGKTGVQEGEGTSAPNGHVNGSEPGTGESEQNENGEGEGDDTNLNDKTVQNGDAGDGTNATDEDPGNAWNLV